VDTLRLDVRDGSVEFFVNDRNLREWIHEIELPFAEREGSTSIAGSYVGVYEDLVFLPSRHLLGEPVPPYSSSDGRAMLYVCADCQEPGCWPFYVRIALAPETVSWDEFEQPHRRVALGKAEAWRYDSLGPFVFERKRYEVALSRARGAQAPGIAPGPPD